MMRKHQTWLKDLSNQTKGATRGEKSVQNYPRKLFTAWIHETEKNRWREKQRAKRCTIFRTGTVWMGIRERIDFKRPLTLIVRQLLQLLSVLVMAAFRLQHWKHGGCGQYQRKEGQSRTGDRRNETHPPSLPLRREERQETGPTTEIEA